MMALSSQNQPRSRVSRNTSFIRTLLSARSAQNWSYHGMMG
jgi:hypothetical protein